MIYQNLTRHGCYVFTLSRHALSMLLTRNLVYQLPTKIYWSLIAVAFGILGHVRLP